MTEAEAAASAVREAVEEAHVIGDDLEPQRLTALGGTEDLAEVGEARDTPGPAGDPGTAADLPLTRVTADLAAAGTVLGHACQGWAL